MKSQGNRRKWNLVNKGKRSPERIERVKSFRTLKDELGASSLADAILAIHKNEIPDRLIEALAAAPNVDKLEVDLFVTSGGGLTRDVPRKLRPHEQKVMELLAQGYGYKELAIKLGIKERVAQNYAVIARYRLGVKTNLEAVHKLALDKAKPHIEETNLTPQLRKTLELFSIGENTHEVAKHLNVSTETIKTHRKRLFKALGVSNMPQAIAEGFRRGILK